MSLETNNTYRLELALHEAVTAYSWQTPQDSTVWCPYLRNGGPCQPEPGILNKPGGGKASPIEFREAAAYAYDQLDTVRFNNPSSIAAAVGQSLVDGSLGDERYDYTGVDCSGFTVQALAGALQLRNIDFYGNLIIPRHAIFNYISDEPVEIQKEIIMESLAAGSIRVADYLALASPIVSPARRINAKLLLENTLPVTKDSPILAGDIIDYKSSHSSTATHHPVLVIGTGTRDKLRLAHSTRIGSYSDVGGVAFFEATPKQLWNAGRYHLGLGYPSVRRLAMLENDIS